MHSFAVCSDSEVGKGRDKDDDYQMLVHELQYPVLQQSLILSVLGFPVGFVLAEGLYAVARQATGLPIVMTVSRVIMVFGLTVLMCGASGLLAMRKLKSADPADAF
jgi:ABC-type antimicrobial peptide transport system permease subunit